MCHSFNVSLRLCIVAIVLNVLLNVFEVCEAVGGVPIEHVYAMFMN